MPRIHPRRDRVPRDGERHEPHGRLPEPGGAGDVESDGDHADKPLTPPSRVRAFFTLAAALVYVLAPSFCLLWAIPVLPFAPEVALAWLLGLLAIPGYFAAFTLRM